MFARAALLLATAAAVCSAQAPPALPTGATLIAAFDGTGPEWNWRVTNDPVMGGKSFSKFNIAKGEISWGGAVEIVPKLAAPGFCNLETQFFGKGPDVSSKTQLILGVKTSSPSYSGFKFSFAADTLDPQFRSYKSNFNITKADTWEVVALPWDSFSNDWSPFTGDCDTKDPDGKQHTCCTTATPKVCPTTTDLKKFQALGLWTEGHAGNFTLDVAWIGAM